MPRSLFSLLEVLEDRVGQDRVERGDRLIGQDQLGLLHQGAGDAHPLLLAAGERVGAHVRLVGQPDLLQAGHGPLVVVGGEVVEQAQERVDVAQAAGQDIGHHRRALDQVELLEDHADLAADLAQLRRWRPR